MGDNDLPVGRDVVMALFQPTAFESLREHVRPPVGGRRWLTARKPADAVSLSCTPRRIKPGSRLQQAATQRNRPCRSQRAAGRSTRSENERWKRDGPGSRQVCGVQMISPNPVRSSQCLCASTAAHSPGPRHSRIPPRAGHRVGARSVLVLTRKRDETRDGRT